MMAIARLPADVAPSGGTTVRFIAGELVAQFEFKDRTKITYGTTAGGWPGDVPLSRMASSKLRDAGFVLPRNSGEAVQLAIRRIIEWLPDTRIRKPFARNK